MSDGGWVKIYRKSLRNGWLENTTLWQFWCYCLMNAAYKPHSKRIGFQRVELVPGQLVVTIRKVCKEIKSTPKKVRKCLQVLLAETNIDIQTTNKYTIISIVNWEAYQGDDDDKGQTKDKQRANKGHTRGKPLIVEEGKESKEEETTLIKPDGFDLFWEAYPRKIGKVKAMEAWKRANGKPPIEKILSKLDEMKQSDQWTREGGQFIPHPTTWINQGRWDDVARVEISKTKSRVPGWGDRDGK